MTHQDIGVKEVILGALLHDIGKFGQRAGAPRSEEMTSTYCPTHFKSKRPTHLHVLYTDAFIEHDLVLPAELEGSRAVLAKISATHHLPEDTLASQAISVADCLSSGSDRLSAEESTENFKKARLVPIFQEIALGGKHVSKAPLPLVYDLTQISENPYPMEKTLCQGSYENLYEAFLNEASKIAGDLPFSHYLGTVASILEDYTWCIPSSSYKTIPDVSLFDHLWTTAAIAQSLYGYHEEEGGLPAMGDRQQKFIAFSGDISGIQAYIFNVEKSYSKGVAKLFRARSFFLQMLTRSVIIAILDRLSLYPVARIMDAGGKFMLLLPNTSRVRKILDEIDAEVQGWFLEKFKGELALITSSDLLTQQDLSLSMFSGVYGRLMDNLDQEKQKKFTRAFGDPSFSPVFKLDYNEYQGGNCAVCTKNAASTEKTQAFAEKHGLPDEVPICRQCYEQIEIIGTRLANDEYSFVGFSKGEGAGGKAVALYGGISMKFYKRPEVPDPDCIEIINFRDYGHYYHYPAAGYTPNIHTEDLEAWRLEPGLTDRLEKDSGEFREGAPKTFSMIAQKSQRYLENEKFVGKDFLAAFKADVDNLGLIFSIGFEGEDEETPSCFSISRLASLSRMFNHFFAHVLVDIIKRKYRDIYLIYAGGDDLFLLGPWTKVLEFAEELPLEFNRYVAGNPEIHFSAGIALAKHRYPIRSFVGLAEANLEASKAFNHREKNAFTAFNITAPWTAYSRLLEEGKALDGLIREKDDKRKISTGFVNRLLRYARMRKAFLTGKKQLRNGLYLSLMRYDIERNLSGNENKERFITLAGDGSLMEAYEFPASYALYRNRK